MTNYKYGLRLGDAVQQDATCYTGQQLLAVQVQADEQLVGQLWQRRGGMNRVGDSGTEPGCLAALKQANAVLGG